MENFFYNDKMYDGLEELIESLDIEDYEIEALPDNWSITCYHMEEQKMFKLSLEEIMDNLDDERFSHDHCYKEWDDIYEIIADNMDIEKINELMPSLWYPLAVSFKIKKSDLAEYINDCN